MNAEKVVLSGDKLRAEMQKHFRAFVADVRVSVDKTGVVALEVHFAQQPLPLSAGDGARSH
jgi:hypothetical protein